MTFPGYLFSKVQLGWSVEDQSGSVKNGQWLFSTVNHANLTGAKIYETDVDYVRECKESEKLNFHSPAVSTMLIYSETKICVSKNTVRSCRSRKR